MLYIIKEPFEDGGYPPPQSLQVDGLLNFPEELLDEFNRYNGFVTLTVEGDTVTAISPNVEAWEEWKASQPEEPPKPENSSVYDELAAAYKEGVQGA